MDFDPSRLRRGEWIAGASSLVLLASTFLLKWYGVKGVFAPTAASLSRSTSYNGWHALTHVRWLVLLTVLAGLALFLFQATRSAPAIPVTMSVITTVLGILTLLALIYRVLINTPGPDDLIKRSGGGYVALLSAVGLLIGTVLSMREEGISPRDAPSEIETVRLE
jgi:hypothetical protein